MLLRSRPGSVARRAPLVVLHKSSSAWCPLARLNLATFVVYRMPATASEHHEGHEDHEGITGRNASMPYRSTVGFREFLHPIPNSRWTSISHPVTRSPRPLNSMLRDLRALRGNSVRANRLPRHPFGPDSVASSLTVVPAGGNRTCVVQRAGSGGIIARESLGASPFIRASVIRQYSLPAASRCSPCATPWPAAKKISRRVTRCVQRAAMILKRTGDAS